MNGRNMLENDWRPSKKAKHTFFWLLPCHFECCNFLKWVAKMPEMAEKTEITEKTKIVEKSKMAEKPEIAEKLEIPRKV